MNQKNYRPSWDEFWLMQGLFYSTRGTCDRLRTGCVVVDKNKRLVSAGYNGSSAGAEHCDDVGHLMIDGHCMRTLHAEENALLHASPERLEGATMYMLYSPCLRCANKILNTGIARIVYAHEFGNMHGGDTGWDYVRTLAANKKVSFEHVAVDFTTAMKKSTDILEGPGGILRA